MPRFVPPATISKSDADYMIEVATKAIVDVADSLGYTIAPGWFLDLDISIALCEDLGWEH